MAKTNSKKTKSTTFATLLYNDRFNINKTKNKKILQRNSITEYTGLSALNEKLEMENKTISNSKNTGVSVVNEIVEKYFSLLKTLDYSLSIPPRVPFNLIEKSHYKEVEKYSFNYWKFLKKDFIFERNIEIWRQFWLTCERADTIAQIIDSRNTDFFINEDIMKMYPNKNHLILCNKSDLIDFIKIKDLPHYKYSAIDTKFNYNLTGTIGLIGYPNVGKSSTINLILKQKKVRVSSTPGKTKYLQTIETPNFTLLDCPGLVFPKHNKVDLLLMGVLNVDQVTDLGKYEKEILKFIGNEKICKFYKLNKNYENILLGLSIEKGWVKLKCLKQIIKDFSLGIINY